MSKVFKEILLEQLSRNVLRARLLQYLGTKSEIGHTKDRMHLPEPSHRIPQEFAVGHHSIILAIYTHMRVRGIYRAIVALICSDPGVTVNRDLALIPWSRASRAIEAARDMSS